jgi:quinone-modifying oxidoreductase subunit QmoC
MAGGRVVEPDIEMIREIRRVGGDTLKKCYQCATCSVVCNLSPAEKPFPRKEMLWAQWGQRDKLMGDPDVFLCHQCNDCSTRCPRGAKPGDVLAGVRSFIYESFAFPRFMGKALASPKALPLLILIPAVVILALMYTTAPRLADGSFGFLNAAEVDFNLFLPHSTVDAFFVLGNILIFAFAAIGFVRFWKAMNAQSGGKSVSFIPAVIATLVEIFSHRKFKDCETNKPRAIAHMLTLFGFVGAMITTGAVLFLVFLPHYAEEFLSTELPGWAIDFTALPLNLPHPIKILGMVSGLALVIGTLMLVYRRQTDSDNVGANGYPDKLFLWVLFLTGLTGMTSWLTRYTGVPMISYINYFFHILCVYFLLWYMPYSKFAHMIYRGLAIVYARQINRQARGTDDLPPAVAEEPKVEAEAQAA